MEEKIIITNDNNEQKEFDIIFTFVSKDTGKKYVTYTDYTKDYKGKIKCLSSYYDGKELKPVTTDNELRIIDEVLKTITNATYARYKIEE